MTAVPELPLPLGAWPLLLWGVGSSVCGRRLPGVPRRPDFGELYLRFIISLSCFGYDYLPFLYAGGGFGDSAWFCRVLEQLIGFECQEFFEIFVPHEFLE